MALGQLLVSSWEEELEHLELIRHFHVSPSLICDDQQRVMATPPFLPSNLMQLNQVDTTQNTTPAIKTTHAVQLDSGVVLMIPTSRCPHLCIIPST